MKTIYKKMRTAKSLLFLLFTLLAGLNAQAADTETIELELGKEYSGTMMNDLYMTFTPTQSGKLVITGKGEMPTPYTDATFETVYADHTMSFVSGGKEMEMNVAQGVTYYFCIRNHVNNWSFTARMVDASVITMTSASPAPNQEFPLSLGGFLEIHFDTSVTVGQALLQTGTTTAQVSAMAYGKAVSMELKPVLYSWMKEGVLKAGDTFTLTLSDVKSAYDESVLYNGDGQLVLTWTASAKPAEVVKATLPEKFLSFWPSDAQGGVVTVEYDAELSTSTTPVAFIGFGSPEVEGDYYNEEIPVQVQGKTITLDFRGTRRVPSEMVASGTNYGQMRLKVNNICSADGNYVYSEGQGTFGSFQHMFVYEEVGVDLTTEFTPASGSSLAGVNSIELWMNNADAVSFDGVSVEYKSAAGEYQYVQYTKEECNYKNEGADGITLTIPVTAEMQQGVNVAVNLTNLSFSDGQYREISAVYNPRKVLNHLEIIPANEAVVTALESASIIYDTEVTVAQGAQASVMAGRMEVAKANIMVSRFDAKTVLVALETPITEPGYYRVLIPEGVISSAAGETNDAISLMYEVQPETSGEFTFTPEDGSTVPSLKEIIVSYPGGCHPAWNGRATLVNEAGTIVASAEAADYIPADKQEDYENWVWNPESSILVLDQEITEAGTYTLHLPEGFLICGPNDANSPEVTATFIIANGTSIGSLFAKDHTVTVYTTGGVRLLQNATKAQLQQLRPGTYIINGKKVYLRK